MIVYRKHPDHTLATHSGPLGANSTPCARAAPPLKRIGSTGSRPRLSEPDGVLRKCQETLVYLETLQGRDRPLQQDRRSQKREPGQHSEKLERIIFGMR